MTAALLRALGKGDCKVVAVFAANARSAEAMAEYIRASLDLPIWLYTLDKPSRETAAKCTRVITEQSAGRLWLRAQRELWGSRVALALGDWDGRRSSRLLKLAPLTVPFFRALFRNAEGEFFPGSVAMIALYNWRAARRLWRDASVRAREIGIGAALWVFAFIAQWNSALSRAVFRRIRGTKQLSLHGAGSGAGIETYRYSGRAWNAGEIAALTLNSEAQYMYFQRDDDDSDPTELLPLFREPEAFVVSRQHAVREWRKILFATAPFRTLAPGERSRVAAPVSPAMLVDLSKLRALGIPELSSYGSNWFVLFFRAAAAGWNSYSVGGKTVVTALAAVPFDEAEFVKTVLDQPELRSLSPRNTALARGNIAQSVVPGPSFRGLPRVLIVAPYLPFPLSHGGAVRIWNLCRALSDRVDFVLASFREKSDVVQYRKLHEVFREVYVVDIDERHHDPALPKQVNGYESSAMAALIRMLGYDRAIGALQVEYTQMARYREAAPEIPAILVEHDLTFSLYRQLAENGQNAWKEYRRWLAFERERLKAFSAVWTMSDLDRANAIAQGSPEARTAVIPNGVDLAHFLCPPPNPQSREVLFVGSFRHLPNYLAFEELRSRIMPAIWQTVADATLVVVAGPRHLEHWPGTRHSDPRIKVHGFVQDLIPLYNKAAVAAVPLPVSAGTNIKLMEALSCGRPVVTTPAGCAGLGLTDGRDLMIRELGAGFSEAVTQLLEDPELRTTLARNGLSQARERFGWESVADAAYESYCVLNPSWRLSRSARPPQSPPPSRETASQITVG